MNHIYRIIWSQVLNAWVAVAESSRGRGKGSSRKLVAAALSLTASFAQASPAGGEVVAGAGSIAQSGNTTTVTQASQNLSLNWQGFNIGKQETVNFAQPSSSAIAVNRIFDTNGSQILGHLNANGQVYLINPNGILFGQGAQVNVGALVASTLNVNDASLAGNARLFSGAGTGSIVNRGTINAARGGYVALLGNTVSNQGTITAPLGTVALGAGNAVTLNFNGNSLVRMQVDQSVLDSLAENGGLIRADGGLVVMNAGAKDALLASVVNNTGKIEARTVENHEGTIVLLGGMAAGTVHVGGTLDASAPTGGNGGFVETSAAHVKVAGDAKITTDAAAGTVGHWLIDPVDFTIAAAGGDISGTDLGNLLASNSITVQTASGTNSANNLYGATGSNGDIHVNDAVSWGAGTTLTLDAWRNININKSITATGASGKLALKYGQGTADGVIGGVAAVYNVNASVNLQAGNNFSTQLGSAGSVKNYTVITSLGAAGSTTATDLQGMNGNLDSNYVLGANIDAGATAGWNAGAGFAPITRVVTTRTCDFWCWDQIQTTPFTGTFDGLGHTISALTINRPLASNIGLFGQTSAAAQIRNIGLVGGSVTGQDSVGALVGGASGTISNSYATSTVTGASSNVGGLVGDMHASAINNSYSTGTVSGGTSTGGLLGYNDSGTISNSYATGNVTGTSQDTGGLAGQSSGTISNSHASGSVQGANFTGGLLGRNTGTLSNSYATGSVSGTTLVGGLVGNNLGSLSATYATGSVNGTGYIGGLLGFNNYSVSYSYATGRVVGTNAESTGGLIGVQGGTLSSSYWNKDLRANGIGRGSQTGSTGLTGAQMQTASSFAAFNFTATPGATGNNWVMVDADGSLNNAGGVTGATRPMLASEYSTTINNAHQLQLMAMAPGANYVLGANVSAATTGLIGDISTDVWGSGGFVPVGNLVTKFSGSLDGRDHTISNLAQNNSLNDSGLFGQIGSTGTVQNLGLVSVAIDHHTDGAESQNVGALAGTNSGTITNVYSTGVLSNTGNTYTFAGGLIGANFGTVVNAYSSATLAGSYGDYLGGLVGNNAGSITTSHATGAIHGGSGGTIGGLAGGAGSSSTITGSYATGAVIGNDGETNYVGGLVGDAYGTITDSYATGAVSAGSVAGGLVGVSHATITNAYATGAVSAGNSAGGLVGESHAPITNAYATGDVSAGNSAGGLVGVSYADITNAYATGAVSGPGSLGYLVGRMQGGSITNAYATGSVADNNNSISGLVGNNDDCFQCESSYVAVLTGLQMQTASSFGGFHFTTTPGAAGNNWVMVNADGGLNNADGSLGATRPMLASEYATTINNAHQLQLMAMAPGANYVLGANVSAATTGLIGGTTTDVWGSAGFVPVGNRTNRFSGTFDGNGHTITGLYINSTATDVALIGSTSSSAIVRNVGLVGGSVTSTGYVIGSLVGLNSGLIINSYATGDVSGRGLVGGLVGIHDNGSIEGSYATGNVQGTDGSIGGLVGGLNSFIGNTSIPSIVNSYATGNVRGSYTVGGLLGDNNFALVSNSHATGNVTRTDFGEGRWFGGLMGYNSGTVDSSYATGSVTGGEKMGGLAGFNSGGTISNSYATGSVYGFTEIGGLVGSNTSANFYSDFLRASITNNAVVTNSYASGNVTGTGNKVGGLVGINQGGNGSSTTGGTASVTNSYATGAVAGGESVGGLVGQNKGGQGGNSPDAAGGASSIANAYSTGSVTGGNYVGGLVGSNTNGDAGFGMMMDGGAGGLASISNSFWNTTTSAREIGIGASIAQTGVTGLTTTQMMQLASFASWNANSHSTIANTGASGAVWRIYEGHTAPLLTSFMTGLTLADAPDLTVTYNGTVRNGAMSANSEVLGSAATGTNAGFYNGYYSTQQGYDISGGNLTINALALSAISLNGIRAYDGTADVAAGIFTLSGLVEGQHLTLTGSGTVADKNVGSNKTVTLGSLTLGNGSGGLASNYTFAGGMQIASITKANLSVTAAAVTKTYDSTLNAVGSATIGTLAGATAGESVLSNGALAFLDKNAGTGNKTVRASGVTIKDAGGTDVSANYTIAYTDNTTSTINKADLAVSGLTAAGKIYDATRNATLAGNAAISKLGTDDVTLGGSAVGTFASKDAGNRGVTVSGNTLSGADAGNYNLLQQAGLTAIISKADLAVSGLTAAGKVYDATTHATLGGNAAISKLGTDDVTLGGSAVGTFASKDVGSRGVTVSGNTLAGLDAANYNLMQQTGLTATITKAPLSYTAAAASFLIGQTPNNLSGTVTGFAVGDTLANASSGALNWTTPADAASKPGSYAIDGSGLLATNYSLTQAASNATALTLAPAPAPAPATTPATAPASVLNATRQLASISAIPLAIVPPAAVSISPAITVTQTTTVDVAGSSTGSVAKTESVASANTTMTIGSKGPALQIVNGGMRMPVVNDNVNE